MVIYCPSDGPTTGTIRLFNLDSISLARDKNENKQKYEKRKNKTSTYVNDWEAKKW